MPTIDQWYNVYTGIQNAVNGLKADMAGIKSALDNINSHAQGIEQNQLHTISQTLSDIENDLVTLEIKVKPDLSPLVDLLKQELVSGNVSFADMLALNLGHISSTLEVKGDELNAALSPLALLVRELTKEGSPSLLDDLRAVVKSIHGNDAKLAEWLESTKGSADDSVVGALVKKVTGEITDGIKKGLTFADPILDILAVPFEGVVTAALDKYINTIVESRPADPSTAKDLGAKLITQAYHMGELAHITAVAAELFHPLKNLGFPQAAAALADLAGFKDSSGQISRALIGAALTRPMRWWGNDVFTPEILTPRDLIELVQKRILEPPDFDRVLRQHGFTEQDRKRLVDAVWREPTIRDLAIAIEDTTVDDAWLLERVRKAGYEDSDAQQLTDSLIQRSLKAARGRVISAALAAVTDGLLDTESYRAILESLQLRQDEIDLQIRTAEIAARRDTVNTAIATYRRQYVNDGISRSDFTLALTALGVNPDRVDLIALDADAQRAPRIAREEEAKLKEAVREIQTELVPRYRRLFELGVIDEVAYENILIEAGVSAQVAAQAVLLDKQKRAIVTQFATAAALERETARLVSETETALRLQYRKGLLDEAQLKASLLDLGYSEQRAATIVKQETVRATVAPGRAISAPAEVRDQVIQDYEIQTAINDFRRGRIEAIDLFDALVKAGIPEDEALARVNLEISRLPVPGA